MLEMRNDLKRRVEYNDASKDVKKNGFYIQQQTMDERLNELRAKQARPKPKRRIPWFTIITVITCIPMFMNGSFDSLIKSGQQGRMAGATPETQLAKAAQNLGNGQTATVSVNIGGQVIQKEISLADIQAMQAGQLPPMPNMQMPSQ